MTDSFEHKAKSFWQKPEGKTGLYFLAILIAGGLIGLSSILPWLIKLAENTLHLMLLLGGIGIIGFLAMDSRFRSTVSAGYKLAMRSLTGLFVTIDPIGILKEHLRTLRERLEEMEEQIGRLKGVMTTLRTKIEVYLKEYKQHMDLAQAAKSRNDRKLEIANTTKAQRRKEASEKLSVLYKKMNNIYRVLDKMKVNCEIVFEDTSDQIQMKEDEWKGIRAAHKAMKSAMSVISGNADERALYEQALEYIADDLGNKIGEMERFLEISDNVLSGIDLQNDVYAERGLKALEEWEKTADSWILGDEKAKLLDSEQTQSTEETFFSTDSKFSTMLN